MWRGHLALVSCRWQDANGTQGRDGLATFSTYDGSEHFISPSSSMVYIVNNRLLTFAIADFKS
jgi:hypothetical protein